MTRSATSKRTPADELRTALVTAQGKLSEAVGALAEADRKSRASEALNADPEAILAAAGFEQVTRLGGLRFVRYTGAKPASSDGRRHDEIHLLYEEVRDLYVRVAALCADVDLAPDDGHA